jgi:hypothetical protein
MSDLLYRKKGNVLNELAKLFLTIGVEVAKLCKNSAAGPSD